MRCTIERTQKLNKWVRIEINEWMDGWMDGMANLRWFMNTIIILPLPMHTHWNNGRLEYVDILLYSSLYCHVCLHCPSSIHHILEVYLSVLICRVNGEANIADSKLHIYVIRFVFSSLCAKAINTFLRWKGGAKEWFTKKKGTNSSVPYGMYIMSSGPSQNPFCIFQLENNVWPMTILW